MKRSTRTYQLTDRHPTIRQALEYMGAVCLIAAALYAFLFAALSLPF